MTRIAFGLGTSIVVAHDEGGDWQTQEHLGDAIIPGPAGRPAQIREIPTLAADPLQPRRMYVGAYPSGLWRSDDGGDSWRDIGAGIGLRGVMSIAVSPWERVGEQGVVYVGTEPSALFRSEDGGESWEALPDITTLPSAREWSYPPRPATHHVRWIEFDPVEAERLYVCIENGALLRSRDRGAHWQDRTPDGPRDTHTFATHPLAPGRLYSAAGDGFMHPGYGYAESRDRGDTWTRLGDGLQHHYLWGLAVDPADPDTVLISAATGPREAHQPGPDGEAHVYRKAAGGVWREITTGLPPAQGTMAHRLAFHPTQRGVLYAVCNQGLFRSGDAGVSFEPVPIAWPKGYRFRHVDGLTVTA